MSTKASDLIKQFEGLKLKAYLDSVGIPTIGYGATGKDIQLGLTWTQQQADDDLAERLRTLTDMLLPSLGAKPTEGELTAMLSLAYNIGIGAFKSSTLLKKFNVFADKTDVAAEFLRWHKAGGKRLDGLLARRIKELTIFLGLPL